MKKLLLMVIIGIFLLSFTSATLGTFKACEPVDIKTILNTSSVTLSTLSYPNGTLALTEEAMQNVAGKTWNYTFTNTCQSGVYNYDYYNAEGEVYVNDFVVNPTGVIQNSILQNPILIILFLISGILLILGFYTKNPPIVFIAGILITISGVYTMIYGFNDYTDWYTRAAALTILALGIVFTIASAYEWMAEVSGDKEPEEEHEEEE